MPGEIHERNLKRMSEGTPRVIPEAILKRNPGRSPRRNPRKFIGKITEYIADKYLHETLNISAFFQLFFISGFRF